MSPFHSWLDRGVPIIRQATFITTKTEKTSATLSYRPLKLLTATHSEGRFVRSIMNAE